MASYEETGPEEPRGWSPIAVAMIATLVLLLGLAGALFGIYVSNVNAEAAASNPTTQPESFPTPTTNPVTPSPTGTASPTVSPSPTVSTTPTPAVTGFALPPLAGLNFKDARTKVRQLELDWVLKFEGAGSDATVRISDPPAGALVIKGAIITIYVKGAAPLATVPSIVGKQCAEAADLIIDAGLYPDYKTAARTGKVVAGPAQVGLRWNDKMQLTCGG